MRNLKTFEAFGNFPNAETTPQQDDPLATYILDQLESKFHDVKYYKGYYVVDVEDENQTLEISIRKEGHYIWCNGEILKLNPYLVRSIFERMFNLHERGVRKRSGGE